jgi:hypothetical protein
MVFKLFVSFQLEIKGVIERLFGHRELQDSLGDPSEENAAAERKRRSRNQLIYNVVFAGRVEKKSRA